MENNISKEKIIEACQTVMHPAINSNLVDLGITNVIDVSNEKITIEIKIPFPTVPKNLIDAFASGTFEAIKKITTDAEIDFKAILMNENERNEFLVKEKANWKGGESACG